MVEHYSHKIQNVIQKELFKAQKSIKIAVAWFTNDLLFQPLLLKLQTGVSVELILNKDDINNSEDNNINFAVFLEAGGVLHWNDSKRLMHEKFCIIDEDTVIYGTYNWTNKAEYNDESIAISHSEQNTTDFYLNTFEKLCSKYTAEISDRKISVNRIDPFSFEKGELMLDLYDVLVYRWIINEKYVYRIFSKESQKQICLYDFDDILIHPNKEVTAIGVNKTGVWYFYSLNYRALYNIQYSKIKSIKDDNRFWIHQEKVGIADGNGNVIISCIYDSLEVYNNTPYIITQKKGKYGVSTKDRSIWPCAYDEVKLLYRNCFLVKYNNLWGVLTDKNEIILRNEYDEIEAINDDYFIVSRDQRKGLIHKSSVKLECCFEDISYLGNHRFLIKDNGEYGVFTNDDLVVDIAYDEIEPVEDDYFIVRQGKRKGLATYFYVNLECKYDNISYLDKQRFLIEKKSKFGLFVKDKIKLKCEYDELNLDGKRMSFKDGKAGIVSENGDIVVNFKYNEISMIDSL